MGKLTDVAIRAWIRSGERFEGRSDGDGLMLTWREKRTAPSWRLRYRFSGKPRVMEIGSYSDLTLAAARQAAKEHRANIALGHDVAGEKQERKSTALARIEAARSVTTVSQLADEYFERMINGRWKHPNIVRSRNEKDIKPHLGKLALDAVEPRHIDSMLRAVVKRGAPTIANDLLRWVRRMLDYAIKRHLVRFNPAAAFDLADAGGKELARERALSRDELVTLFEAIRQAKGFSVQNELTVKLLLLLALRKGELTAAFAAGAKVLVLTERTEHLDALRQALGTRVSPLLVLHGRMSAKQRTALLQELEALPADAPRVLLSTGKLVGEGFDHAPLDTLVLAMPISWKGTLAQYAGRLHREHASKSSVRIVDFVDEGHPALLRMWERRQRGYQAMGYRVIPQGSGLFDPDD